MEEIKVEVLDQKLEDLRDIVVRIDSAIEKLSEVNSNVSKMLAVHEERITKQEEIDTVLFAKIDKLRDKMDLDHDKISARLSLLERRVWTAVGALAAAAILSNPQATRLLKPLFSSAQSAIIAPVVAVVNESH